MALAHGVNGVPERLKIRTPNGWLLYYKLTKGELIVSLTSSLFIRVLTDRSSKTVFKLIIRSVTVRAKCPNEDRIVSKGTETLINTP